MKKLKYLIILSALLLAGCSQAEESETIPDATSETTTVSVTETEAFESEAVETEISEATEPEPEFTTVIAEDGEHIIYWKENGTEKSEVCSGYPFPDDIIHGVLGKYFDEESAEAIYAADWVVDTYYEEVVNEAGPARVEYHTATLDLSEGYSFYVGEELLSEVTESIGKSLMENFDITSISISEMRETIIQLENN